MNVVLVVVIQIHIVEYDVDNMLFRSGLKTIEFAVEKLILNKCCFSGYNLNPYSRVR
ncbi:hypothetical protein ECHSTV_0413 [Ehrlichia chaffeensis str. Saint Vincent]|nr:hypothetical protein ECHSTV_0413 [Ehrlichia chaffeensis str. Saint Vincent]